MNFIKSYLHYLVVFLLFFYLSFVAYQEIKPKIITIEAGPVGGFFHTSALLLKKRLKEKNIEVNIIHREDTLKIIEDVNDLKSKVDIGFIAQNLNNVKYKNTQSLGSTILEPLFIIARKEVKIKSLADLKGPKIAASPINSGTRVITEKILDLFGVNENNSKFYPYSLIESANALKNDTIDVAFFLQPANNKIIEELGKNPKLKLVSLDEAGALSKKYNYIYTAQIDRAGFDIKNNLPENDVKVIAVPVTIIGKKNLNPSVVTLISLILKEEFREPNLVSESGKFPTMEYEKNLEINQIADQIFKMPFGSEPFLYRLLPLKFASIIDDYALQFGFLVTIYFIFIYLGAPKIIEFWEKSEPYRKLNNLKKIYKKINENKFTDKDIQKFKKITAYFEEREKPAKQAPEIIKKISVKIKKYKT